MPESYFLWHDWHWVQDRLRLIGKEKREQRRWDLARTLASAAARQGGEDSFNYWQGMFDSTISAEEREEQAKAQEAEDMALLREQRRERAAQKRTLVVQQ